MFDWFLNAPLDSCKNVYLYYAWTSSIRSYHRRLGKRLLHHHGNGRGFAFNPID